MSESPLASLVAVDIGNSRMKLGRFADAEWTSVLPRPRRTLRVSSDAPETVDLDRWLAEDAEAPGAVQWWIGSVCRPATTRLLEWIRAARPNDEVVLLSADDVPLDVDLPHPDMVGIDRLLDAVGANALRTADRAAVVVDVGTAVTVDYLDERGVFRGGAILPGIGMSARALHEFTDLLPLIEPGELADPPRPLGRDTVAAMKSGLYWGTLGAIRELAARMGSESGTSSEVFLTGGAGEPLAALLGDAARCVPELTLGGIALTARETWTEEA